MPVFVEASRVFSDDYTASGQLSWRNGGRGPDGGEAWWREGYLGQLRFDALFNETLVIPDTHIIDGVYFLERGPKALMEALGRSFERGATAELPLEIRTRGDDFETSLSTFLLRFNSDGTTQSHLNGFYFKAVEDTDARKQLAAAIRSRAPEDLERCRRSHDGDVVDGVLSLLRECFSDTDYLDVCERWLEPLGRGWRLWLDEGPEVDLRTERWSGLYLPQAATLSEPIRLDNLKTDLARDTLEEVLAVLARSEWRNDANPKVDAALAAASGDRNAEAEIEAIDWWLSRGRYRAITWQHRCDCIHVDRPLVRRLGLVPDVLRALDEWPEGERTVDLPDNLVTELGSLENAVFSSVVRDKRSDLVEFWRTRNPRHIGRIAEALDNVLPTSGKRVFGFEVKDALELGGKGASALAGGFLGSEVGSGLTTKAVGAVAGALASLLVVRSGTSRLTSRRRHRLLERAVQSYARP